MFAVHIEEPSAVEVNAPGESKGALGRESKLPVAPAWVSDTESDSDDWPRDARRCACGDMIPGEHAGHDQPSAPVCISLKCSFQASPNIRPESVKMHSIWQSTADPSALISS